MLIYKTIHTNDYFVYIHIPKNGGKYIRGKIKKNKQIRILKSYWNQQHGLDMAHIPYVMKDTYVDNIIQPSILPKNKIKNKNTNTNKTLSSSASQPTQIINDKNELDISNANITYHTYVRNPYHRIISAYFYKNPQKNKEDFKKFVKNILPTYLFHFKYRSNIIHYYPQYMFVCDENKNKIEHIQTVKLEDTEAPREYNLCEYYDQETLNIVNKIYKLDFEWFGYNMVEKYNNLLLLEKVNQVGV